MSAQTGLKVRLWGFAGTGHPAGSDPGHQHPGAVAAYLMVIHTAYLHRVGLSHWLLVCSRRQSSRRFYGRVWTSQTMDTC
mgnify:CR=1 FL=1